MTCRRQRASTVFLGLVAAVAIAGPGPPAAAAQPPTGPAARLAVEDDGGVGTARVVEATRAGAVSVAVRVVAQAVTGGMLDERLAELQRLGASVWLSLPVPPEGTPFDQWRRDLRGLLERHGAAVSLLEVRVDDESAQRAVFAVQVAAIEARARASTVRVAIGGAAMNSDARRAEIYTVGAAPYVDLLVVEDAREDILQAVARMLEDVDPQARVAVTAAGGLAGGAPAERELVDRAVGELGSNVEMRAWPSAAFTGPAIDALSTLAPLLQHEISVLDREAMGLTLTSSGADITAAVRHRRLFDVDTFSTYLAYWGDPGAGPLDVTLTLPIEGVPRIYDLLSGTSEAAQGYSRDAGTGRVRLTAPVTGRPMLVNFNEGAAGVLTGRAGVSAERQLSIGEIISRHQQQQAAQDARVRSYVASARMQQYFRPTVTDPGYDVVTENRYFVSGDDVEWEELSFSVNGSTWTENRPPFPLLQPEKVLALPLQLRFDEGYRYELAGTERVDGFDCYVVRFEPVRREGSLYRGTVWIDRQSFARIRVHAVQGGLPAPVVSNEETLRYVPVEMPGNRPVFLFGGMTARQIMLIAGRNLLVERNVSFSGFRVNDPEFDRLRASAHESDRVMYRETDAGLRYFVKEDGRRVVSDRPTASVKAMALGVTLDPSYAFPLPIAGLDYLDFAFGSPDTQLALLFAGVLAAGNIQRPQLGHPSLDASLDFFAIAVPASDRLYERGGEAEGERVLTWPMTAGLNLGWQATPFQKATLQYQFRFDAYAHDTTTSESFELPASTVTNGIGGAWEYRRGGYSLLLSGTWFRRAGWEPWGASPADRASADAAERSRSYAKYSAGLSRTFFLGPFQKIHLDASWFGGRDLDRFVMYQFGMFDPTRIHGVPASGVRFEELAMIRGSYSFNVFNQYRLDLFAGQAWGRDDRPDADWQPVPGIGAAVNFRTPWNTILRADVGKSFLPDRYRHLGSATLQIMLLKPLR